MFYLLRAVLLAEVLNEMCCFVQKHNRRKAAKEHVRQKLQEHTGLTPQPHQAADDCDITADDISGLHDKQTKIKKCCVSFKLLSPGSVCSCKSVSSESANVPPVIPDVSAEKKRFVTGVPDIHLPSSTNSKNLQPAVCHDEQCESVMRKADVKKPKCSQSCTRCSELVCNNVSLKNSPAVDTYSDVDKQQEDHLCLKAESMQDSFITIPEIVNRQCIPDLHVFEESASQEGSSSIANSLNASQNVQSSGIESAFVTAVSSTGCERNFSFMDEELLACFMQSDNFDVFSSEIDVGKRHISEDICYSVDSDSVATVASENVESRTSSVNDCDDAASLCHALSVVKIVVAESTKSGVVDFTLPDSQYDEIIRLKFADGNSSYCMSDNMMEEDVTRSTASSSLPLSHSSSAGQHSSCQLLQKQWYVAKCSALLTCALCLNN